jgi:uncharacterized protein YaeQ
VAPNSKDSPDAPEGEATMVIRYWAEPGHPEAFRARITFDRGSQAEPTVTYAGNAEQVVSVVRGWLDALSDRPKDD